MENENTSFFNKQVFKKDTNYFFRLYRESIDESAILYHVNQEWDSITLLEDHTKTLGQFAFKYLSNILPLAMLKKDVLTFHGVLMEYNGQGIIFSANSGVGKTTHARLWKKHKNSFIINGDKSSCYKKDGIWTGFGTPWCGTSGEYMNREVPIKAIVLIERGSENQAERIAPFAGFKRLLEHALYPAWEENLASQALDLLSDFIENIPVYRLQCLPDKDSVDVLEREIFRNE